MYQKYGMEEAGRGGGTRCGPKKSDFLKSGRVSRKRREQKNKGKAKGGGRWARRQTSKRERGVRRKGQGKKKKGI